MEKLDDLHILERRLEAPDADPDGPTLICAAAVHGDEPAGLMALQRVLRALEERRPPMRGRFFGLVGNRQALGRDLRYVHEDLNRIWLRDRVRGLEHALTSGGTPGAIPPHDPPEDRRSGPRHDRGNDPRHDRGSGSRDDPEGELRAGLRHEAREQWELLREVHEILDSSRDEVYFLDLHTSSAQGEPFLCIGDTLRNRGFALHFQVPVILGLEECIDGALLEYVNNLGVVTMGVEAGQHRVEVSVEHHEAFVWLALVHSGVLAPEEVPGLEARRRQLREAANGLPRVMEVRHRHPVERGDGFRMEPGFRNFQRVEAGELLARDDDGPIHADESGRVLLPLYQGLGSDGFFLTREVRPFWLKVSAWLRHLRLDAALHWLPGVHGTDDAGTLEVDPRVARWYAIEIFHLLGYRKHRRSVNGNWVLSRRRYDHRSPYGA